MIAPFLMMLPISAEFAEMRSSGALATLTVCLRTEGAKLAKAGEASGVTLTPADTVDAVLGLCHIFVKDYRATLNGVVEAHLRKEGVKGFGEDAVDTLADETLAESLLQIKKDVRAISLQSTQR